MRSRADGFSLFEALAALVLTALVAGALVTTAIAQMRLTRAAALRAASADAIRTTRWVLGGEARRGLARDVRAYSGDSVALRAFRGRGIVCRAAANRIDVRYSGDRLPDAAKDSVLLLSTNGEFASVLLDVRASVTPCAPTEPGERSLGLVLDRDAASPLVALLFEPGNYYLTARALRYRLGSEGRQPLTAELFQSRSSGFVLVDSAAIRFRLAPDSLRAVGSAAFFAPPGRVP